MGHGALGMQDYYAILDCSICAKGVERYPAVTVAAGNHFARIRPYQGVCWPEASLLPVGVAE